MTRTFTALILPCLALNVYAEACGQNHNTGSIQMSKHYIRDKHLNVIGSINTESDGKQRAYDKHLILVGTYDCRSDRTYDRHLNNVGSGNQLVGLIWQAAGK